MVGEGSYEVALSTGELYSGASRLRVAIGDVSAGTELDVLSNRRVAGAIRCDAPRSMRAAEAVARSEAMADSWEGRGGELARW